MKAATVALIVQSSDGSPLLVETLSDETEIAVLEGAVQAHAENPMSWVREHRIKQSQEDEEFGEYVEDLLSHPFIQPEIREHGIQWLQSKIRIEEHERNEGEAAKIIADYAYKYFCQDTSKTDFLLAGPRASVRVRVFLVKPQLSSAAA